MALEKCFECGHDVSSMSEKCTNCGAPNIKNPSIAKKPKRKLWIFSVAAVCVIVFFIFIGFLSTSGATRIAMTSYDCKEVGEAIKKINNPEQLMKISKRCWREANANRNSWNGGLCWASHSLMAADRAVLISKKENSKP